MNIDKLIECKDYIRNWNRQNDITEHEVIIHNGVKYKWIDKEAKENWVIMGLLDSDIIGLLKNSEWFKVVDDE